MEKMNAMSLKAKVRNIAKTKGISAQVVLQNYFFERFLYRLSRSEYREKFILKGGLLIAAMTGHRPGNKVNYGHGCHNPFLAFGRRTRQSRHR